MAEQKDGGGTDGGVDLMADIKKILRVCRDIQQDMADDARDFDGKPFTGRTVGEYFGNQGAAIAALARFISDLAEREKGRA